MNLCHPDRRTFAQLYKSLIRPHHEVPMTQPGSHTKTIYYRENSGGGCLAKLATIFWKYPPIHNQYNCLLSTQIVQFNHSPELSLISSYIKVDTIWNGLPWQHSKWIEEYPSRMSATDTGATYMTCITTFPKNIHFRFHSIHITHLERWNRWYERYKRDS